MPSKSILKFIFYGLCLALALWAAVWLHRALAEFTAPPPPPESPQRIISLAPSVTETLFALGLGDRVVGVTQFCDYPPEAKAQNPVVAGFSDINYEAVLRQRPDLVALPVDKQSNQESLERLGLTVLTIDTRSIAGLMEAISTLGQTTGNEAGAQNIRRRLQAAIESARARAQGRPKPRVLFAVMHSEGGLGYISEINAVGRDGFFDQLIDIAGGENVYKGALSFPRLSREAIIFLNPDIIVDIIPETEDLEAVRRDWLSLTGVKAVENGQVFFLTDKGDTVPGPRLDQTLMKLSQAFHPEAGAKEAKNGSTQAE